MKLKVPEINYVQNNSLIYSRNTTEGGVTALHYCKVQTISLPF
jgi:hypothetical protein